VGTQLVVGLLEGIEDALLEIDVRGRGPSGAGLEGLVQAFVGAVLLGAAGRDALVGDPQLKPPDVETVEPVNAGGGKRGAVITVDRVGEAVGTEQPTEVRPDPGPSDVQQSLTAEEIPTEVIEDRQRVAVDPDLVPEWLRSPEVEVRWLRRSRFRKGRDP
jgi:hypothetical protein